MNATRAFLGAKSSLDRASTRHPRAVLLGMEGNLAQFRRGTLSMTWRFTPASSVEEVIDACRSTHLGSDDVLVVPLMSKRGAAVCEAYGVAWCDAAGRCDISTAGPENPVHYQIWFPVEAQVSSVFDDDVVADVAWFLASNSRAEVTECSMRSFFCPLRGPLSLSKAVGALESSNIVRRAHGAVRFVSRRVSSVVLELLSMSDDALTPPDPETSRRMRAIRSRDTYPELVVRRALHSRGIRYRTQVSALPGTPDLANKSKGWAVFVNGCFWHGHGCERVRAPRKNAEFWREKFADTKRRDEENVTRLKALGYDVYVVWECELDEDALSSLVSDIDGRGRDQ